MRILVIHGPNLNMLGKRNKKHYGACSLDDINGMLSQTAKKNLVSLLVFQSNHEGELINFLQKNAQKASGILINPGALTHYSYSLRDALEDTNLPTVEVHLSDISKREPFREIDVLDGIVIEKIVGLKEKSYIVGLENLINYIRRKRSL
ncbi:3-dehydroquinate dehydratase [Candidatus Gottesmanbacteria bacterium]|nr:3-dehydroquinate dehydratase [Candidatus Gottesmanbacteria bacterium]